MTAHWTEDHTCSNCGEEAFKEIYDIRPEYDYDWDENLVQTGRFEYDIDWKETKYCPYCGALMDNFGGKYEHT